MNILLLHPDDEEAPGEYRVSDYRHEHLVQVLKARPGEAIRAGLINGPCGEGRVLSVGPDSTQLSFQPTHNPPQPLPVTLLLALPRPKMMKRILVDAVSCGIKDIHFINSWKVEKSFWKSPALQPSTLYRKAVTGLEQAGDTRLPVFQQHPRFKPFMEDTLPSLMAGKTGILAHPKRDSTHLHLPASQPPLVLAIGPEGGFTDYEVQRFLDAGFSQMSLGPRILRVETALPYILGVLAPCLSERLS